MLRASDAAIDARLPALFESLYKSDCRGSSDH